MPPVAILLILILSIVGLCVFGYRAVSAMRSKHLKNSFDQGAVIPKILASNYGFWGKEQSPIPSYRAFGSLANDCGQQNAISVYQANIVQDHQITIPPRRGFAQEYPILLTDSSDSDLPGHKPNKSESPDTPDPDDWTLRPIAITDSSSSSAVPGTTTGNKSLWSRNARRISTTLDNIPLYPTSNDETLLKGDDGNLADDEWSEGVSQKSAATTASSRANSDKENEAPRMQSSLYTRDSRASSTTIKQEDEDTESLESWSDLIPRALLQPYGPMPPNCESSNIVKSATTECERQTAVEKWLNDGSPTTAFSLSESENGISPGRLTALLFPYAEQPPRIVLKVRELRRGAPRAGRRAPERFKDSEYSVWRK